ncbi:Gfo/Idh/MocA family oxidoreductase [Micromonospora soli]|uniref:Gfo/Idh/MocA family protein n=1 Tax=Micromonospora sp. NBRC 110009 TaxID=3061627 RepID=UPI002672A720|nr:Gfo/Idh/MocA family oxidoreductase [Micromonospora sp. NBRC 110009]WKT96944.1 Gfo/Idh/MocA family oxidoreductase [Micromonospora sp. NBRC 110009]
MTGPTALRIGVVGAGRFAAFVTGVVHDLPDIRFTAVADPDAQRATQLATALTARPLTDWRDLIGSDDVDAVVIASPPATHAALALAALRAGRHVFCEKPLATDEAAAAEVQAAVTASGRALVVDHVLRYNPILCALVRLRGHLLGPVRRLAFENDASDEDLGPDHWFWDERVSGGIFVEHGVHFFDAAIALIGAPPEAVQGMVGRRPGTDLVDLAVATTRHPDGALATFAHGFSHAHRCERQLMRIDFGVAEARISGWIPVHAALDLWTDDSGAVLVQGLPARTGELLAVDGYRLNSRATIEVTVHRNAGPEAARERGREHRLPHHCRVTIDLGGEAAKQQVYAESVRAAMVDFVRCIRTGERPAAGVAEGSAAVSVAVAARRSAREDRTVHIGGQATEAIASAGPVFPQPTNRFDRGVRHEPSLAAAGEPRPDHSPADVGTS